MRIGLLSMLALGCGAEAPVDAGCEGWRIQDNLDDGVVDRSTLVRLDAAGRTVLEAGEDGEWWVETRYGYDATGLVEEIATVDGEVLYWIRWQRRPDGQPLTKEEWNGVIPDGLHLTVYAYDGDLLVEELGYGWAQRYRYDEHGRLVHVERIGGWTSITERWYTAPAPALDGGLRQDVNTDGTADTEFTLRFDGERPVEQRGTAMGVAQEYAWTWRPDGLLAVQARRHGPTRIVSTWDYDEGGRPMEEVTELFEDGSEGSGPVAVHRTTWNWACPGG